MSTDEINEEPDVAKGEAVESYSFVIDEERAGQRLDVVLAALADVPRAQVQNWIEDGRVCLSQRAVSRPSRRVAIGDVIEADPPPPRDLAVEPEDLPLEILYEDSHLIVVDKAAGMVVHPAPGHYSGTMVNALLHHCEDLAGIGGVMRPGIVHRLDRGTSGVIVAAKNDRAHQGLARQFHDHSIDRVYQAFVRGVPRAGEGRIDQPIGRNQRDRKKMSVRSEAGRESITNWKVLERFAKSEHAHLEIRPETGRTHQIRVHLSSVGLPILGDDTYGKSRNQSGRTLGDLKRPALHAASLGFEHPATGERMHFEASLPEDLRRLQEELRSRTAR